MIYKSIHIGVSPIAKTTAKANEVVRYVGRGGKRVGAGRKQGSVSERNKELRARTLRVIKAAKKVPLETMLQNMERFDDEAQKLYNELNALRADRPVTKDEKKIYKYIESFTAKWSAFRECTLDAHKFAVDAAPYMHQRLAHATVDVNDKTNEINRVREETAMTDDELASYYQQLRMRPTTIEPMVVTIDNDTGELVPTGEDE